MSYQSILISDIISKSKKMFECQCKGESLSKNYIGSCGYSQSCIYYSARLYGVPKECIKVCQGSEILRDITHGFIILILDQLYLCDLSFSQFICEESDIEQSPIKENKEQIKSLWKDGYTLLTEPTLINFYTFCHRQCYNYPYEPDISTIGSQLQEKYKKTSFNILQITINHSWSNDADHTIEEFLEYGCISQEEKEELEK